MLDTRSTPDGHASTQIGADGRSGSDCGDPASGQATPVSTSDQLNDPFWAAVAQIWIEELSLDEVAPDDDFFDLGGISLQVITVIRRMRTEVGIKVPARTLYEAPRLGDFVERARAEMAAADAQMASPK